MKNGGVLAEIDEEAKVGIDIEARVESDDTAPDEDIVVEAQAETANVPANIPMIEIDIPKGDTIVATVIMNET